MFRTALRVGVAILFGLQFNSPAQAQNNTIGGTMVSYLQAQLNTRVGSGECTDMATEALRICGGEFLPADLGPDSPSTGDKDWGTLLKTISYSNKLWSDSSPTTLCQPGDVMQFGGSAKIDTLAFGTRHTAVIAAVDARGLPTSIYHQNFGKKRYVTQLSIDTTKLIYGWIRIYRPIPVILRMNEYKVTIVNNVPSTAVSYNVMMGANVIGSYSLTADNTTGSFRIHNVVTNGTVPNFVNSDGASLFLQTAKGNQQVLDSISKKKLLKQLPK